MKTVIISPIFGELTFVRSSQFIIIFSSCQAPPREFRPNLVFVCFTMRQTDRMTSILEEKEIHNLIASKEGMIQMTEGSISTANPFLIISR